MDHYPYGIPPKWWSPRPRQIWTRFWRPMRRFQQRHDHRIVRIDVEGVEHVQHAINAGFGVLIVPNHASHADCYLMLEALQKLPGPSYFMTAWQVFFLMQPWQQLAYRHHGCFSVDREGKDLRAFRQAIRVLADTSHPLIVFPEGEVYHLNDHVTPFRDGTFMLASSAVKRAKRPVACVPCALKYHYINDPTAELRAVAENIERRLGLLPAPNGSLARRVEDLQIETLRWREQQYLRAASSGPLAERRDKLANEILTRHEKRFEASGAMLSIPERAKQLRQRLIERSSLRAGDVASDDTKTALDDIFVAVQLYSYEFGYVERCPTIERIAETIDKLEEDVLGAATASIRGTRRGTVRFAEPLVMDQPLNRAANRQFGQRVRARLQETLDGFRSPSAATAPPVAATPA